MRIVRKIARVTTIAKTKKTKPLKEGNIALWKEEEGRRQKEKGEKKEGRGQNENGP